MIAFILLADYLLFHSSFKISFAFILGIIAGVVIGFISEYYTSSSYTPTKKLAESSQTGAATNIINGLSLGMKSTFSLLLSYL